MTIDVRRAYFYAPAQREAHIEILVEDQEAADEGMVGKLNLSLYGTRDAALNWTKEYTRALDEIGFVKGMASACNFRHVQRDVKVTVHGDDFLVTGSLSDLLWLQNKCGSKYEIKTHLLGPEDEQQIKILNRVVRWSLHGLEYEADHRHVELVIKELGLATAKPVSTPSTTEEVEKPDEVHLNAGHSQKFTSVAARVNFLAQDRPDIQHASRGSQHMSNPTTESLMMLKRIGRCLHGVARCVQHVHWSSEDEDLLGFADSDWAGSKRDAKLTSGGALLWGGHLLNSWSTGQSTIALSSGEAEFHALTKVAAQMLGLISMADFVKATCAKTVPQQRWAWCSRPAWAEHDMFVCSTF